jgi:hypothetical protein
VADLALYLALAVAIRVVRFEDVRDMIRVVRSRRSPEPASTPA